MVSYTIGLTIEIGPCYSLHSLLFPQDVFVLQDSGFCHSQRMNASAHMICHNTNGCIHIPFLHLCLKSFEKFQIFPTVTDISEVKSARVDDDTERKYS